MNSTPNDSFTFDFNDALQDGSFGDNLGLGPSSLNDLQSNPAGLTLSSPTQHSPSDFFSSNSGMPDFDQRSFLSAPSVTSMQSTAEEPSHIEAILALLQETLAHNGQLWNILLETERVAQRHRHMSKALFMQGYPVGRILFRGIVAMTQNFVMRDGRHRPRPGSRILSEYVRLVADFANEAVVRVTRGHAHDAAAEHQDHGILLFQQHIITWAIDSVVSRPDCLRRTGRSHVQSTFGFYSGGSSVQHNRKQHRRAAQDNAFIRNTTAVMQLFKKFYISDPSSIAWQMEYVARLTPSALVTLPGETPVVLWSVDIPDCVWVEVVTIINHILREWEPGKWRKMYFDEQTAQFSDTLHGYATGEPGVRRICEELARWLRNELASGRIDVVTQTPEHLAGENTDGR